MDKSATKRITIEVPVAMVPAILELIKPDWSLLPNFYPDVQFQIHLQGTKEPIIKAVVSK